MAGKRRNNNYHVMRSMDQGEYIFHPWLTKPLAEKLAGVLREIEDDRRLNAEDKRLRNTPEAFDSYYVKQAE